MITAKKLGFKKGDWVMLRGTNWVAKLLTDVHTATPVAMVFGFENEAGSVYASDLEKIPVDMQQALELQFASIIRRFKTPLKID